MPPLPSHLRFALRAARFPRLADYLTDHPEDAPAALVVLDDLCDRVVETDPVTRDAARALSAWLEMVTDATHPPVPADSSPAMGEHWLTPAAREATQ